MFRLFCVAIALLLASCSEQEAGQGQGDDPTELIFNTYLRLDNTMAEVAVKDFSERMEAESGGSIQVEIPGGSLAQSSQQWGLVADGTADLAMVPVYANRGRIELTKLAELPFNSLSAASASAALWRTQQEYFSELEEFAGYKLLSLHVLPPSHFYMRGAALASLADLKGKKIWTGPGMRSNLLKELDAIPVNSEYTELYEYVSKGTVDGVMVGGSAVQHSSLGNHLESLTKVRGGLGSTAFAVIMNQSSWEALSPSQQAAVERAAQGIPEQTGALLDDLAEEVATESHMQVQTASPAFQEALENRLEHFQQEWIEMARGKGLSQPRKALEYYRDQMRQLAED